MPEETVLQLSAPAAAELYSAYSRELFLASQRGIDFHTLAKQKMDELLSRQLITAENQAQLSKVLDIFERHQASGIDILDAAEQIDDIAAEMVQTGGTDVSFSLMSLAGKITSGSVLTYARQSPSGMGTSSPGGTTAYAQAEARSIFESAVIGAGIGAGFGPVGAAVGGVIGALAGLLDALFG